jgi:TolB-like protein/DNA-binding winged helix-turn-helix (wHTH) protein
VAVTPDTLAVVRFAQYEIDLREQVVRLNGVSVAIQDKPLQLLLALLERPGQLISREELRNRLWPTDAFGAFEDGLNTAVRKLRIALNDSAETPQFIETVPRRGYRFIAPVSVVTPQQETAGEPAAPVVRTKPRVGMRWLATGVVVATIIGGLWIGQRWWAQRPQSPHSRIRSIAVLPLVNLTGDATQNYFVDGMTDELTTSLAQLGGGSDGLRVISETSASHYRGTTMPLRQIAQELGVDAIVEGSVARSGGKVRVTAQLIDVREDRHLWAESYVRNGDDVLGLQHEVARAIADRIQVTLTPAEAHRLGILPTQNPAAYDAYLRARYLANSGVMSRSDNVKSLAAAEEAVALDPNFAQAYLAVAFAHQQQVFSWAGGKDDDEKAIVALDKAIALNPNLADAYVVRGALYYNHLHAFDIVNSVANFRKAIALNANSTEAHHFLGSELTHAGLHDQAIEEYRAALKLDPLNDPVKYRLGRALWQSERFEESLQNYDRFNIKAIEEAIPLIYLGRRQRAWDLVTELTPQSGQAFRSPEDFPAVRALLFAIDGDTEKADHEIREAINLGKTDDHFHHAAFIIAASYAEMGKPHEAVEWLRRTSQIGMPNYPLFHDNPSMKKLAGNQEYEQFMAEFKPRWDQFAQSLYP